MNEYLELLARFNRKERNVVLRNVLASDTYVSPAFIEAINCKLNLSIPANPFWAIDYHLDWLAVCTWLLENGIDPDRVGAEYFPDNDASRKLFITSFQTDADVVLAYKGEEKYHVVLFEAKFDTPWSKCANQVEIKRDRINYISKISDKVLFYYVALYSEFWPLPDEMHKYFDGVHPLQCDDNLLLSGKCVVTKTSIKRGNGAAWSVFRIGEASKSKFNGC